MTVSSFPPKASLKLFPWSQGQDRPIKAYVVKACSGVGPVQWPYPPQEEVGKNAGGGPGCGPAHRSVGPTSSCGQEARAKRRPPPRFKTVAAAPSASFGRWGFRGPYFFFFFLMRERPAGPGPAHVTSGGGILPPSLPATPPGGGGGVLRGRLEFKCARPRPYRHRGTILHNARPSLSRSFASVYGGASEREKRQEQEPLSKPPRGGRSPAHHTQQ